MNVSPWVLLPAECQQNEAQFILLQPVNGLISGDQARPFFLRSGLPPNILAQIWQLADLNKDGKLDRLEFFIAMRLVRNCLSGLPLPSVLPESIKQLPSLMPINPITTMPQQPPRPMSAYGGPLPPNYGSIHSSLYSSPSYSSARSSTTTTPTTTPSFVMGNKELGDWSIPQHLKLRFSQQFNQLDKNRIGLLTGAQVRGTLGESQLPTNVLAQIWAMADVNKSGCLSIEQFCVAMFLIEMVKSDYALPATLPQELNTFCHRSKTASPLTDPTVPPPQKTAPLKTFEDKRRDNLDRGQAELERRRQILREEEERRRAEIERKEHEDEERRERERQELEKRREAEREAERLREMERERERAAEEERIKQEREEARRRLEQERIKELEKIRVRDLETQHQNELEKTTQFQQRHKTMTFQLQAMEEKSQQVRGEITDARDQIIAITSEIEGMRESRDQKLVRINELQTKSQQLAVQCERIGHEHLQLQSECQKTLCRTQQIENTRQMITQRSDLIATNEEKLKNAKERLAVQEKQITAKKPELEANKEKLTKVTDVYNKLVEKFRTLKEEAEKRMIARQKKVSKDESSLYALPPDASTMTMLSDSSALTHQVPNVTAAEFDAAFDAAPTNNSGFDCDFTANFDAAFSNKSGESIVTPSTAPLYTVPPDAPATTTTVHSNGVPKAAGSPTATSGMATTVRYRALFEFVARSDDELSIQPGDTILVFENHASEPGWLAGQIKEKVGWFPAAFAERLSITPTSQKPISVSIPTSPSTEPLESIKEEPVIEKEFIADFSALSTAEKKMSQNSTNGISSVMEQKTDALYDAPPGDVAPISSSHIKSAEKTPLTNEPVIAVGIALYQWKARNDMDLSFNRNEVIEILEQGEMRWRGRLQKKPDQQGWFPKSYVKISDEAVVSGEKLLVENEKKDEKTVSQPTTPSEEKKAEAIVSRNGGAPLAAEATQNDNVYIAMYQFDAVELTDLSLKPGDMIHVIESSDEWWRGSCNGKTGIFPANYVQKASSFRPQGKQSFGKALAAFEATGPNQISLRAGDLVRIHSTSPGGWWEGEVERDGAKTSGWFPGNYVQIVNEDGNLADVVSKDGVALASALFDYNAQHDDEMTFKAGDVLEVLGTSAGPWWKGRHHNADSTAPALLFPANFVQLR